MGTIRKVYGEFYYRKDGKSYKFLNQEDLKKRYPTYEDPVHVDDETIITFESGFVVLAAFKPEALKVELFEPYEDEEPLRVEKVDKMVDLMNMILSRPKTLNEAFTEVTWHENEKMKWVDFFEQDKSTLSSTEALYGFCGWLTSRQQSVIMGRYHDAAPIVELINEFVKENNLPQPRENWADYLKHPGK